MMVKTLWAKVKLATVTKSSVRYEGSLGLDPAIMRDLQVSPYQVVNINSIGGDIRTETYLLEEGEGTGAVVVRGALANILYKGDQMHVNVYVMMSPEAAAEHKPLVIESNEPYMKKNKE